VPEGGEGLVFALEIVFDEAGFRALVFGGASHHPTGEPLVGYGRAVLCSADEQNWAGAVEKGLTMRDLDEQFDARIEGILGDALDLTSAECVERFYEHLRKGLQLPCEVTGIEDFDWEEYYVVGPGDPEEYEQLRQDQPSYRDVFLLLDIKKDIISEWMLFPGEDLAAGVRRQSDGREFCLGLAELKAVDKQSANYQLLDDYAVWLVNNR